MPHVPQADRPDDLFQVQEDVLLQPRVPEGRLAVSQEFCEMNVGLFARDEGSARAIAVLELQGFGMPTAFRLKKRSTRVLEGGWSRRTVHCGKLNEGAHAECTTRERAASVSPINSVEFKTSQQ